MGKSQSTSLDYWNRIFLTAVLAMGSRERVKKRVSAN